MSREVAANGGLRRYRAARADHQAWARSARPKRCKLAENPVLRGIVEETLQRRWSPQQIAGCLRLIDRGSPRRGDESQYRMRSVT